MWYQVLKFLQPKNRKYILRTNSRVGRCILVLALLFVEKIKFAQLNKKEHYEEKDVQIVIYNFDFFFSQWKITSGLKFIIFFKIWFALVKSTIAMWFGRVIQFLWWDDNRSWKSNFTHTQESKVPPRSDSFLV